jgi:hypothetical protein
MELLIDLFQIWIIPIIFYIPLVLNETKGRVRRDVFKILLAWPIVLIAIIITLLIKWE